MNNKEMSEKINQMWKVGNVSERYHNQIEAIIKPELLHGFIPIIKSLGFDHLSNVTCVDWINEGHFDVTYNLWSYEHKLQMTIKVAVDRDKPEVSTIDAFWPQAQVYEREIHEMFGVKFLGNPDLTPLFLHNWQDIPPLRKDFDSEKYSITAYAMIDDEGNSVLPKKGGAS